MKIKLPILKMTDPNDFGAFIDFWKKLYFYPLENLYDQTIHKKLFDSEDVQRLYIWKNGMKLSDKKQLSLETKIIAKLELINYYKAQDNWAIQDFQENFGELTAVWKIYLLHIIKPGKYPIYDQHINRAYNFIHGLSVKDISANMPNIEKEKFYFQTYLPFIQNLKGHNLKYIDEAFFSFGQFINTNRNDMLFL